jgi:hypothetical protein
MMRAWLRWGLVASLVVGCNVKQLTAERVMVATFLSTPANVIDAASTGIPSVPSQTLPSETGAFVFLGDRSFGKPGEAPSAVSDAVVSFTPSSGSGFPLVNVGAGIYTAESATNGAVTYQAGSNYSIRAVQKGTTFEAKLENAPAAENVAQFRNGPLGPAPHTANQPYSIQRADPTAPEERNVAFITVYPMSSNGTRGPPTYTNVPTTALDYLTLIAASGIYRQSPMTVPGSAFPNTQTTYLVLLQSAKTGGPASDNLFSGSAILAGAGAVGFVRTQ